MKKVKPIKEDISIKIKIPLLFAVVCISAMAEEKGRACNYMTTLINDLDLKRKIVTFAMAIFT